MPTPQERLASAARFFFETALPQASGKSLAQLTDPSKQAWEIIDDRGYGLVNAGGLKP
jgi:hypothetical protein